MDNDRYEGALKEAEEEIKKAILKLKSTAAGFDDPLKAQTSCFPGCIKCDASCIGGYAFGGGFGCENSCITFAEL